MPAHESYQPWTHDDEAELRRHVDDERSGPWIAKAMGRTYGSISNKVTSLGLRIGPKTRVQDVKTPLVESGRDPVAEWTARRDAALADVQRGRELYDWLRPVELPPVPLPKSVYTANSCWVVSSDHHWPIHDERAESIILQAIDVLKPRGYVLNGDGPDMLALSKYPKDARRGKSWELRDEQLAAKSWWWNVASLMRAWGGEMYETEANHSGNERESRWRRYLNEQCSALFGLDGFEELMTYQRFFHPSDVNVRMVDEVVLASDLRIRHGEIVRKHGGYSARAHGDKWQSSVMHGHTHRIGSSMKRRPGIPGHRDDEFLRTYETGCVCKLDAEYCPGADWQQGFAVVHVDDASDSYGVELVQIINGRATSSSLGGTIAA